VPDKRLPEALAQKPSLPKIPISHGCRIIAKYACPKVLPRYLKKNCFWADSELVMVLAELKQFGDGYWKYRITLPPFRLSPGMPKFNHHEGMRAMSVSHTL
jgi:hypothetical protein